MPRNANTGVYTPPANSWNPATPDTVISSADWNALRDDMATALSHAPSTTRALHPTTGQVQDGAFIWGGTAGGTADALTLTLAPAITSYATGMVVRFVAAADNASATPTLSINGVTPAVIARADGGPLAAGEIQGGSVYEVVYSGTQWRLTSVTARQVLGNDGVQFVSGTNEIQLPDNASAAQFVEMSVDGASVYLPDATKQIVGGNRFTIYNNGKEDFFVRPSRKMPLQNGDFSNSSVWNLGPGWSVDSGVATKTPGTASDLSQPLATEDKATYEITFAVTTISGGAVRIGLTGGGADVLGTPRSAPGTYTEILTSTGNTTFVVRADAAFGGSVDNVTCQRVEPSALALLRPNQSASFSLLSNNTPHGVWSKYDDYTSPPKISNFAYAPDGINTVFRTACALNDYQVLHFGKNSSNHLFAYVVNYKSTGVTVGTPTLVSTESGTPDGAHLVAIGKVLFCYNSKVYLASINNTSVNISSPVASNIFPDKRTNGPGPKHAQVGTVVVIGQSTLQAVNCVDATPVVGSAVTIGVGTTDVIGVFLQPSNRIVCFYRDDSGVPGSPFSIRGVVATISGTTITPHTSSGINDVVASNSYVVLEMSKELYLIAYISSSTQASVVAATVSGTSVTFHEPVSFGVGENATFTRHGSYLNEMFQKLSDTEAVLVVYSNYSGLTFAYIKLNGTTLTVDTGVHSNSDTLGIMISQNKKIYYRMGSTLEIEDNTIYCRQYTNGRWVVRPVLAARERVVPISKTGFLAVIISNYKTTSNHNTLNLVFVSTKTKNENVYNFPLFCFFNYAPTIENITSQKTALYGVSYINSLCVHHLLEGVF